MKKKVLPAFFVFVFLCGGIVLTGFLNLPEPKVNTSFNPVKEYDDSHNLDSLRALYGTNKTIPANIEYPALLALSHYPELSTTHIEYTFTESSFPYAARPDISSLIKPKGRKYVVYIDPDYEPNKNIALENLSLNAQIGILGHETGHILYYTRKNVMELFCVGACYYIPPFRRSFEQNTDRIAVNQGLGWQLYKYWSYATQSLDEETSWMKKYYLSPQQILQEMKMIPEYKIQDAKDQQEKTPL